MNYLAIPAFALLSACAHYDTPAKPIVLDAYTAGKYAPATSPRPVARPVLAGFECVKTDHEKCGEETHGERDYDRAPSKPANTPDRPDGCKRCGNGPHSGGGDSGGGKGKGKPDKDKAGKSNASEHNGKGGNDGKGGKNRDGSKNSDKGREK